MQEGKVLVADDEPEIRDLLRLYLEKEGYEVIEAADGREALRILQTDEGIGILLLDIMMPEMDGFHVLKQLREERNLPVVILSARTADSDKILGLDLGADDYIAKPFNPLEVVARVNSNLRRYYSLGSGKQSETRILQVQDLSLNMDTCELSREGQQIPLSSTEFHLMQLFMEHPGKIFTKQQLYETGWGEEFILADNNIMVCISKLRSKLSKDSSKYIKTIRGLGYRLEVS
ncbi:MAG: response regulator transcription factor [Eubacteriales bacterium]|nr:response regulator transcription factor [Eubacteriales bacterium]